MTTPIPAGYRTGYRRLGPLVGAEQLGLSVYELPPGQSICPYHYELGDEEWLIVLTGTPTLRDARRRARARPVGHRLLPEGPDGAHKVTNRTGETLQVALLSTKREPSAAIYPDSDKIGIWPPGKLFRLADAVDYYDGE